MIMKRLFDFTLSLFLLIISSVPMLLIAFLVKLTVGLRPTEEVERQGLDLNEHGEEGYIY